MSKIRPSTQLAQDGATTGQAPVWNGSAYVPTSVLTSQTLYYVDRDRTIASGGETTLTLGESPITNSVLVWKNGGILWDAVDYTISGQIVTFTTLLNAGDVITDYYLTTTPATAAAALGGNAARGTVFPYSLDTYGVIAYG